MLIPHEQKENLIVYRTEKEDEGKDIKQVLKKKLGFSTRLLVKLKKDKNVFINDAYVKYHQLLKAEDVIKILMQDEPNQFEPQDIPLHIVYEDVDLLIINKQPGIVSHPTKSHFNMTIANALAHHLATVQSNYRIRFVNRLDMNTSGLLIIAKNSYAQHVLSEQMKKDDIQKKYTAFVSGIVENDFGTIDAPIWRPTEDSIKRTVDPKGQRSITKYRVIERYKYATKLEVELLTGRTHQIRVHMQYIGHPILGDCLYGNENADLINRQALHASYLKFLQPRYREKIEVKATLPDDLLELEIKLKRNETTR